MPLTQVYQMVPSVSSFFYCVLLFIYTKTIEDLREASIFTDCNYSTVSNFTIKIDSDEIKPCNQI
ncbi:hypothetical protein RchiOBHm_Chr6g0283581 [Rosa chinensis]|uniref:Uncharacterized protein n=1 Tax=Rosa chinensis TaxID=74649 RepID=A0A2P6PU14_ROSCH|nr:hypothetical protein RchiOBHm_Chr6g0283581 [Rosa chinensis]